VQALRRQVFGRVLRQIEVRPDIGGASSVQLVAGEALNHEQRLPCPNGIGRWQSGVDGEGRPAGCRRRLAHQLRHLERPLLAADAPDLSAGPHDVERASARVFLRNMRPGLVSHLDREPGDCLALIGIEREVERQLRDEAVKRNRLDDAVGR